MPTTRDLAARFVPFPRSQREALLRRIPRDRGIVSQLADSFGGGSWYVHRGDLTVDGDLDSTLDLVVDGDLTVRGVLTDDTKEARLVVTGDLRCEGLLSRHLLVVLGSLHARGLVVAEGNDDAFEVWGDAFTARALVVSDRSCLLPGQRNVTLSFDADQGEAEGDVAATFPDNLLSPEEPGTPADFDAFLAAHREGRPLFRAGSPAAPEIPEGWRLDPAASPDLLAAQARSAEVRLRVAAAGHPGTPAESVVRLARDRAGAVRATVVHHPALLAADAARLAKDASADVRRQLAASPHAAARLAALASDASAEVRRALASHPALDDATRRLLVGDAERAVKLRALTYLPATAAWVEELRGSPDELLSAWALEHESATGPVPARWQEGLLDPRRGVREAALRSARDPRVLAFLDAEASRFVTDESPSIRQALATAARDAAVLTALADDADPGVRSAVVGNASAPAAVLEAEAERLAAAPRSSWSTYDPAYADHVAAVHHLLSHPRLPASAIRRIDRAYPTSWRLEPHRLMPLDVALSRAISLSPALEYDPDVASWKERAADDVEPKGPVFAALLDGESEYLKSAARLSPSTPIASLLAHAREVSADPYALAEIARNPLLGIPGPDQAELLALLLSRGESGIDHALAGNPDVPFETLLALLGRTADAATRTLWQVHGRLG